MKAVLCKEYGPPESLVLEDVPVPEPGEGEVQIAVKACGVNFPDTLIIQNKYQFKPPLPFSPGGEVAGVVSKVGSGVKKVKVGDRVIGSTGWGGFAEYVVVREDATIAIPASMPMTEASAFIMTYGTSHYALKDRGYIQPGENLLVLGAAGGVGLAAVELGKAMGARVIAGASSEDKLKICRDHGADETFVYPRGPLDRTAQKALSDKIKELTGGNGADVVYDPVGGDYAEPAIRATNWEGRFLVIGFAAGDIPKIPLNLTLLKGCQIVGVFWGMFVARDPARHHAHVAELLSWYEEGKIRPHVSAAYPLADYAKALNDILERRVTGKAVLVVNPE